MKKEISILNPIDEYINWLIPKFISIAKRSSLISQQLAKIIISDSMTSQKIDWPTKILYNREIVLVWDFTEMSKIKK